MFRIPTVIVLIVIVSSVNRLSTRRWQRKCCCFLLHSDIWEYDIFCTLKRLIEQWLSKAYQLWKWLPTVYTPPDIFFPQLQIKADLVGNQDTLAPGDGRPWDIIQLHQSPSAWTHPLTCTEPMGTWMTVCWIMMRIVVVSKAMNTILTNTGFER